MSQSFLKACLRSLAQAQVKYSNYIRTCWVANLSVVATLAKHPWVLAALSQVEVDRICHSIVRSL
jgi:hypothetical protein